MCLLPVVAGAQTDTGMSMIGDVNFGPEKVQNAFKTSRVINLQSMEVTDAGVMDFKINHRFGTVGQGAYDAFGLDNASVRIGAEYGIVPNLALIAGRSSIQKMVDVGLKYRIMHQTTDNKKPFSLLFYAGFAPYRAASTRKKSANVYQAIIGRKFTEKFSMQLSPTAVFMGEGLYQALGMGMRYKLTNRTTLNVEYIPVLSRPNTYSIPEDQVKFSNSLSIGFDIETGGHVFQLHFTNSAGMTEPQFITQTTNQWQRNRGFSFGFNISRVFTVVSPERFRNNSY
jgi:predicted porin